MSKWVALVIGIGGLLYLATTSLAPAVVAVLVVAVLYQWGHANINTSTGGSTNG
jgi:hypothetical protein